MHGAQTGEPCTSTNQLLHTSFLHCMLQYLADCNHWHSSYVLMQMGFFNDVIGPVVLCGLIILSLATIMMMSVMDFFR